MLKCLILACTVRHSKHQLPHRLWILPFKAIKLICFALHGKTASVRQQKVEILIALLRIADSN
jgi:hypothetical protein